MAFCVDFFGSVNGKRHTVDYYGQPKTYCTPSLSFGNPVAGFTLLEVLVALIIIGISLGAVFQAFSQSKRISWKSDEVMESSRIANNIFANSALIDASLREKGKEGVVEGENGWRYTISVHPLEIKSENEGIPVEVPCMLKLRLCLVHETGQRKKSFCLSRWYRR